MPITNESRIAINIIAYVSDWMDSCCISEGEFVIIGDRSGTVDVGNSVGVESEDGVEEDGNRKVGDEDGCCVILGVEVMVNVGVGIDGCMEDAWG
jgi:hypothetical protein